MRALTIQIGTQLGFLNIISRVLCTYFLNEIFDLRQLRFQFRIHVFKIFPGVHARTPLVMQVLSALARAHATYSLPRQPAEKSSVASTAN
jgi:hypothetical protein